MKNFRVLCAALALMTALAVPAFGGEIGTGKNDPPPQPAAAGEIGTGVMSEGTATTDLTAAEVVLSLLQGVLALV